MFCTEILNSNPAEWLADHPFILGLPAARMNGVPFLLVFSGTRVANKALVFSIRTHSKLRVVFVCKALLRYYTPVMAFLGRFFVHFLGLFLLSIKFK